MTLQQNGTMFRHPLDIYLERIALTRCTLLFPFESCIALSPVFMASGFPANTIYLFH